MKLLPIASLTLVLALSGCSQDTGLSQGDYQACTFFVKYSADIAPFYNAVKNGEWSLDVAENLVQGAIGIRLMKDTADDAELKIMLRKYAEAVELLSTGDDESLAEGLAGYNLSVGAISGKCAGTRP
jgi:hypothetical protein